MAARRALRTRPDSLTGQLMLAEGYLCKGLVDDPWALEEATIWFRRILARNPSHLWARIELADALRKRYPASNEALEILSQVDAQVSETELGAAREEIRAYVAAAIASISEYRYLAAERLAAFPDRSAIARTTGEPFFEAVQFLAGTGERGAADAELLINERLATQPSDPRTTLAAAELCLGRKGQLHCGRLYLNLTRSCRRRQASEWECDLARARLKQIKVTVRGNKARSG